MRWRDTQEDAHCLFIFYESSSNKKIEKEVALFMGANKE